MKQRSKSRISSGTYGKAFLAKAWEMREDLLDYERRRFAQFFYLTVCGHLESVIISHIKMRLFFITQTNWEKGGAFKC